MERKRLRPRTPNGKEIVSASAVDGAAGTALFGCVFTERENPREGGCQREQCGYKACTEGVTFLLGWSALRNRFDPLCDERKHPWIVVGGRMRQPQSE